MNPLIFFLLFSGLNLVDLAQTSFALSTGLFVENVWLSAMAWENAGVVGLLLVKLFFIGVFSGAYLFLHNRRKLHEGVLSNTQFVEKCSLWGLKASLAFFLVVIVLNFLELGVLL